MSETEIAKDFLGLTTDQWKIVVGMVGPVVGAAVTYSQRKFFARPRAKLRADLELLNLMDADEVRNEREKLAKSVSEQVEKIYLKGAAQTEDRNYPILVIGLLWALAFGWATLHVLFSDDWSDWWIVLTGWLTLAGLGWMLIGWQGKWSSERSETTTVKIPSRLLPQVLELLEKHGASDSASKAATPQ